MQLAEHDTQAMTQPASTYTQTAQPHLISRGLNKQSNKQPSRSAPSPDREGGWAVPWPRPGYSPVALPVAAAAAVCHPSAAPSGGQPVSDLSTDPGRASRCEHEAAVKVAPLFP